MVGIVAGWESVAPTPEDQPQPALSCVPVCKKKYILMATGDGVAEFRLVFQGGPYFLFSPSWP